LPLPPFSLEWRQWVLVRLHGSPLVLVLEPQVLPTMPLMMVHLTGESHTKEPHESHPKTSHRQEEIVPFLK
jgi:hypothetical protein